MRNSGDLRKGRCSVCELERNTDERQQASSISPLCIRFRSGLVRLVEADSALLLDNRGPLTDGAAPSHVFSR